MFKRAVFFISIGVLVAIAAVAYAAGTEGFMSAGVMSKDGKLPERDSIDKKYRWDLSHLFKDDIAWAEAQKGMEEEIKAAGLCRGTLSKGAARVKECLDTAYKGKHRLARLSAYAMMRYHADTRVSATSGMKSTMDKIATSYAEAVSFIEPELLMLDTKTLEALSADKSLADYSQFFSNLVRKKPHVLDNSGEEILAASGIMGMAPYNIYTAYTGSDMEFGEITDSSGNKVKLTVAAYMKYRESTNRDDRKKVFEEFFGSYKKVRNFMATTLGAQVDADVFYAKSRKYNSSLEAALFPDNIPVSLYENLIKSINSYIPVLHRYLKMRKELLGLTELRYYDLYVPVVKGVELSYTYEDAVRVVEEALAPMGVDYLRAISSGMKPGSGWVDVYPNEGKKSGAYMTGDHYDVHPYVLLNFIDNYDAVSTLAHEMGHAMHSYLSNSNEPYPKSDYPIFLAEVASTFNEALLMENTLKSVKEPEKRLSLLIESMEMFRTTMFRQAMFAEFELELYRMAERREPLTADSLSAAYLKLLRKYYGHEQGVVTIDDLYGNEWEYIPHFYYNFYVYQYVTGFIAANALAQDILISGAAARDRYLNNMLKKGSSDYALNILKRAGVDMLTSEPYEKAVKLFEKRLEDAEKTLAEIKNKK